MRLLGELQEAFGAGLNACELVSDTALGLVLKHIPGAQAPLAESPWHLLVEISGEGGDSSLHATLEAFLEKALERGVISDAVLAQSSDQARRLWALRENISEAQKIEGISIKHDLSVAISHIGEFIERADAALKQFFPDFRIVAFGHVGDGICTTTNQSPKRWTQLLSSPFSPRSIGSSMTSFTNLAAASAQNTVSANSNARKYCATRARLKWR